MSIMAFLKNLFGSKEKSKSVLGIDVGSSSVKVVQLRKQGGVAMLETYGELALGPYADMEIGQATKLSPQTVAQGLNDLIREANVTASDCGISIPFSRSLVTLVELPRRENPQEQRTVIELEARKYIPVPIGEVQLDWFIVPDAFSKEPEAKRSTVRVLLVAVHNDELSFLQKIVELSKLSATFYEIEIFSTIRSVVEEPVKPIMVLDIGAASTKLYIVERGVIALSHTIPEGGQHVTRTIASTAHIPLAKAEALKKQFGFAPDANASEGTYAKQAIELVFSRIFEEARRVVTRFESTTHRVVSAVVLTGGGGVTPALQEYARTIFSIDVQVADPFGKVEAPAFMRPVLDEIGPEFSVAVGLALRKLEELK